uniref:Uncharacterized protein n=1 Tax=Podoviridae sp. ctsNK10 TaxID=2826582 RepID=A0A8S5NMH2_9CAUD|nr:MAG TPA: hypothetical protein [Podoviridae sp. ctsNK10]
MLERSLLSSFISLELLVIEMNFYLISSSVYLSIFSITINNISLKYIYITSIHIEIVSTKIRLCHILYIRIKNLLHLLWRFRIYLIHSSGLLSSLVIILKLHVIKQITCPVLKARILRWSFSCPHSVCRWVPRLQCLTTQYKFFKIWIICTITHSFCSISLISLH